MIELAPMRLIRSEMAERGELDDLVFPLFKKGRIRDRAHLDRICDLGCCVQRCRFSWLAFLNPWARSNYRELIHPHHIRIGAGTGIKPGDDQAAGICFAHHHEGHQCGWRTFERKYGIDLHAISQTLWAETLDIRSKQQ